MFLSMDSMLGFVHLYNVDPTKIDDQSNDRQCLILIGLIVSTKMDVALYYLLYSTVLIQECTNDIFNIIGNHTCDLSKRLAMQGIYFSSAYFLLWMFWVCFNGSQYIILCSTWVAMYSECDILAHTRPLQLDCVSETKVL